MNEEDIEYVVAMTKDASAEMEQYKDESEFNAGAAWAYRHVLITMRDVGWIKDE